MYLTDESGKNNVIHEVNKIQSKILNFKMLAESFWSIISCRRQIKTILLWSFVIIQKMFDFFH